MTYNHVHAHAYTHAYTHARTRMYTYVQSLAVNTITSKPAADIYYPSPLACPPP